MPFTLEYANSKKIVYRSLVSHTSHLKVEAIIGFIGQLSVKIVTISETRISQLSVKRSIRFQPTFQFEGIT